MDIFFVISGFVITGMLQREHLENGRIRFVRFYVRRFKRLTPALALMVTVTTIVALLILSPFGAQQAASSTATAAILIYANFSISRSTSEYFDLSAESNPLLNTWSLSVEEQFYLVFPAFIALGWFLASRRSFLRHMPWIFVGVIAIVSFMLAIAGSSGPSFKGSAELIGFYSPLTRAWEFAAGSLLALVMHKSKTTHQATQFKLVLGPIGLLILVASLWLITDATPFPGYWTLLPVAGTILLLYSGTNSQVVTTRVMSWAPVVKTGDWSYSIYLWHWPFIVFALILWPDFPGVALIACMFSFGPAIASYVWLENPLRRARICNPFSMFIWFSCVMIPPLFVAGVVGPSITKAWQTKYESGEFPVAHSGDIGHDDFYQYMEDNFYPCTPELIRVHAEYFDRYLRCQQSQSGRPVEVAIVGDSHAEHLFTGLAESSPGANIAFYMQGELPVPSSSKDMARILDLVGQDNNIKVVIVAAAWFIHGVPVTELTHTLEILEGHGKSVFLLDDIPNFSIDPVQCRSRRAPIISESNCTEKVRYNKRQYNDYIEDLRVVAGSVPGVELIKTNKFFCNSTECSMSSGSNLLYRDLHHLNINGSKYLAQKLRENNDSFSNSLSGP